MKAQALASGAGWFVWDLHCSAGPNDRPFEEQHRSACIALVAEGTFRYRTGQGSAVLVPGALLLGNRHACFECGHEHAAGDRCISFHFSEDHLGMIAAGVPGVRRAAFDVPRLPPLRSIAALAADIEHAAAIRCPEAFEELALRLAGAVFALLSDCDRDTSPLHSRDVRRITGAVRHIETHSTEAHPIARLARDAGMTPYHFLRVFTRVVGMTPHQYVLRTRLHRVARRLLRSRVSILTIAVEEGFNDLSTFNRRFRRVMGVSPTAFRRMQECRTNAPKVAPAEW